MSDQANEFIGCFDEIPRSHGGVLAECHVVLAPDVEGRDSNLAGGNLEIVVDGAVPIERRGKGSWLGKPLHSLVNQVFRHARIECSAQPSRSSASGLLKGERVRRREQGQRLEPLWM